MSDWQVWLVPLVVAVLLFLALYRQKDAPGVAYVVFVVASGVLLFVIVVDTGWYKKLPPFILAGRRYGLQEQLSQLKGNLQQVQSFQNVLAATAGISTPPLPTPSTSCCEARSSPGCDDQSCMTCVCAFDPRCCSVEWDYQCSEEARGRYTALGTCHCACAVATACYTDSSAFGLTACSAA